MSDEQAPDVLRHLDEVPLIGILRRHTTHAAERAAWIVAEHGIRVLEVTMDSPHVSETIRHLAKGDGIVIGAGTVTAPAQVATAADAGAEFVVTPNFDPAVIATCLNHHLPVICGAASPTEIVAAHQAGSTAVKVFPAEQLGGPAYIRAIRAPLRDIPMVPTGGVSLEDAPSYLKGGAVALGVGGSLFPARVLEEGDWRELEKLADRWMEAIT